MASGRVSFAACLIATAAGLTARAQQFALVRPAPTFSRGILIALASSDVDRDGDLDLLGSVYRAQPMLLLSDGTGGFVDASATRLPAGWLGALTLAVGDVDGDGDDDALWGIDYGQRAQQLWLNDGQGGFFDASATHLPPTLGIEWTQAVRLVDLDGDGDLDALIGNAWKHDKLLVNDGSGHFTDATATRWPTAAQDYTTEFAVADFDGDGDVDFVTAATQRRHLLLNDGTGTFVDRSTTLPPAPGAASVAAADFDGDGDVDLYFGCKGSYQPAADVLMANDGGAVFTDVSATSLTQPPLVTEHVVAFDADEDGDQDVATIDLYERVALAVNDGSGHLVDMTASRVEQDARYERSLLAADLDGDGDGELVLGSWDGLAVAWNRYRHLEAPAAPRVGLPYTLRLSYRPGFAPYLSLALPAVATAAATRPFPPFGTLRLDPAQSYLLTPVVVPAGPGVATFSLPVPNDPQLAGATFWFQALIADPLGPIRLTNPWVDTVSAPR